MPWFPDIANPAFCETLHLRKIISERQRPQSKRVLEPGSAEFISALAAGSNSRRILHVGCGLSTIALAAAARATGGGLQCVDIDDQKQATVSQYILELELSDYVEFFVEKPSSFIAHSDSFDFVLLTGDPESYIESFDLLRFTRAAIIVAYNALDDATNDYIKHVRQQPGMDSSTLPVGRGIEVSKILSWERFNSGRKAYCNCQSSEEDHNSAYRSCFFPSSAYDLGTSNTDAYQDVEEGSSLSFLADDKEEEEEEAAELDEGIVSPTVSIGTSLEEEESARIHAVEAEELADDEEDEILITFRNNNVDLQDLQTEIKVEGPDRHMLLADITLALNEARISVQGAKISTQNNHVEDVFYVVDEAKKQLDLDQQESVRAKIRKRIMESRRMFGV